jgi:hypothetical protein
MEPGRHESTVVDFQAWRAARQTVAPPRLIPSIQGEWLFHAEADRTVRTGLLIGLFLFGFLALSSVMDRLPPGIGWIGLFGFVITGFILWASQDEAKGKRPVLALSDLGFALDPSGQRRDIPWSAVHTVRETNYEEQAKPQLLVEVISQRGSCSGACTPQAETLRLDANLVGPDGQLLGPLFLSMARGRGAVAA